MANLILQLTKPVLVLKKIKHYGFIFNFPLPSPKQKSQTEYFVLDILTHRAHSFNAIHESHPVLG